MYQFIRNNNLNYRVLVAPVKVVFDSTGKYYEPDVSIVFDNDKIKRDGCYGAPDMIFEIISKSTKKIDFNEKRELYLSNGVKEYFVVDPYEKAASIYRTGNKVRVVKFDENIESICIPGLYINIDEEMAFARNFIC